MEDEVMRKSARMAVVMGLLARSAAAHPGHGLPGWLHHGEMLVVTAVVVAVVAITVARRS